MNENGRRMFWLTVIGMALATAVVWGSTINKVDRNTSDIKDLRVLISNQNKDIQDKLDQIYQHLIIENSKNGN